MKRSRIKAIAASLAISAVIACAAPSFTALAATGTVTGTNVNVRSDASTSSSIVGSATSGQTMQVGESKQDETGATWYQVTLSNGNQGYIRSDFITVTEDAPVEEQPAPEEGQPAEEAPAEEQPAEAAPDTGSSGTGDYQIVLAPDENGNETYYLYNNAAGERMKLSDIGVLTQQLQQAQKEAANAGNKYKVILIVLAVLLALAIALCVALFLRLRDALTNGRKERDLTNERRSQRRQSANADDVNSLRASRNAERPRSMAGPERERSASRNAEPYASGSRRPAEGGAMRQPRPSQDRSQRPVADRPERPAPADRPERMERADRSERAHERMPREGAAREGMERRTAPEGQTVVRRAPAQDDREAPVRRTEARPQASARPAAPERERSAERGPQDVERAERAAQPAERTERRTQSKNFADDDFDYDFISMDEKK